VNEGYLYRVRAATGFGTDDCFRLGVGWLSRNAFGRGQAFEVSGQVSKLGVGEPTSFGPTRDFLCGRLSEDSLGSGKVNYAAAVSLRRPVFLSPANALTMALFAERRSEFQVYRREDVGGSVTLTRETARRVPVSLSYRLSYGATEAQPVSFCAFFNACTEDDIAQLRERRLIAVMTLGVQKATLNNPLDPFRGSAFSFEVAHSSKLVGSSEFARFTRLVGDVSWYYPIGRMVVAAHARAGVVFAPPLSLEAGEGNFVPPEQRFYAGGANDVRGYRRNELGPIVYTVPVDSALAERYRDSTTIINPDSIGFAPTGANTLVVGNLELRVPSPIFTSAMRLGFFVDGGAVWDRGPDRPVGAQFRITPGAGIRYTTPLGPGRLDVAYNGYDRPVGRLYGLREGTREVELLRDRFQPSERGSRFVLQLSIGHAF
jgi:outer membrane protein assembly factor BamA